MEYTGADDDDTESTRGLGTTRSKSTTETSLSKKKGGGGADGGAGSGARKETADDGADSSSDDFGSMEVMSEHMDGAEVHDDDDDSFDSSSSSGWSTDTEDEFEIGADMPADALHDLSHRRNSSNVRSVQRFRHLNEFELKPDEKKFYEACAKHHSALTGSGKVPTVDPLSDRFDSSVCIDINSLVCVCICAVIYCRY